MCRRIGKRQRADFLEQLALIFEVTIENRAQAKTRGAVVVADLRIRLTRGTRKASANSCAS